MISETDANKYKRQIKTLDSGDEVVEIDIENSNIAYADKIGQDRPVNYDKEEFARAYIVAWLCSEGGYNARNIYLEKQYSIGRPNGSSAYADILIQRIEENGERVPFMLIEVKNSEKYDEEKDDIIRGQIFNISYQIPSASVLSLATVEFSEDDSSINCITIDNTRYPDFEEWNSEGRPVTREIPEHFNRAIPDPLVKGGKRDLRADISLDELDRIWRRLHDLLWGGHLDDNDAFEWVTRLLLSKVYDEKTVRDNEEYEFQLKYTEGVVEDKDETFERINGLYKKSVARYLKSDKDPDEIRGINRETFDSSRVRSVVEQLQEIAITPNTSGDHTTDILGRVFGRIIRQGFKQSKGLYLTNPTITFFILQVLDLEGLSETKLQSGGQLESRLPYIIDPSCGSGSFLIGALQIIQNHVEDNKDEIANNRDTKETIESLFGSRSTGATWAGTHLYDMDPHKALPIAAKVNMILHQDGSGHIFQESSLLPLERYSPIDDQRRLEPSDEKSHESYNYPVSESFDVVVSNPPFSIDLSNDEKSNLQSVFQFADKPKSENLFFERWFQLLAPDGRLGVVLPESFFSVEDDMYIRQFALKHFEIKAIVQLPENAFQPYTTTLTSLLFARKKKEKEIEEWDQVWKNEEEELEKEIKKLREKTYKRNFPWSENPSKGEKREWIHERVNECEEYLDDKKAERLRNESQIDEAIDDLRYALGRAVDQDKNHILLERVSDELDYSFPVITVEDIGYKQTTRATHEEPNDLMNLETNDEKTIKHLESIEQDINVIINTDDPDTALDHLRGEITW